MGEIAELLNTKNLIAREAQDTYAISSYKRANNALKNGYFEDEVIPIELSNERSYFEDEDIFKLRPEKISKLKPSFITSGTITPANASSLNDGAAALILANKNTIDKYQIKPLAKIIGFADASQDPKWFTTSPALKNPFQNFL